MKENENLKEELNEQSSEKISVGYNKYHDYGTFKEKKTGKRYNSYCDFCNKKIEGRGSFLVPGERCACINCYKKLKKISPNLSNVLINDEFAGGN